MYSAEQVADILGLHVRTVRGYIRDGRLPAVRVGKQYRIAEADLQSFAGLASAEPARGPRAHVSTVVHIDNVSRPAMDRITTHLTAAVAGTSARSGHFDLQSMYDEAGYRLTVFVVGDPEPTAAAIQLISVLTRQDER
ncbi:hypothetical protein B1R94_11340 [Mycolicibacterium litorale]|nr:hypothetical protein B1R94_11340 [Mycolicibacterium litorale]